MSAESNIIPASKELPDRIYLMAAGAKPVFPGLMFPVLLSPGPEADLLRKVVKEVPERTIGFVLPRDETTNPEGDRILRRYHSMGTASRIMRFEEGPDGSVQALCQGVKRFEILELKTIHDVA